jgi:hypothetical protein
VSALASGGSIPQGAPQPPAKTIAGAAFALVAG